MWPRIKSIPSNTVHGWPVVCWNTAIGPIGKSWCVITGKAAFLKS